MIKKQIGSSLLAMFSVSTVTRYDRTTKEDGEDLGRKDCSVPHGKVEAAHHVPWERQQHLRAVGLCVRKLEIRLTVAGERDSDRTFPAGSEKVDSLFCCLLKSFGCVLFCFVFLIQCSSTKAVNCAKQGTDDRGFWTSDVSEAFGVRKYSVN